MKRSVGLMCTSLDRLREVAGSVRGVMVCIRIGAFTGVSSLPVKALFI